jgi:hypothetical protein
MEGWLGDEFVRIGGRIGGRMDKEVSHEQP